ncbi:guanine-1-methyltransferase-domain-containing protein, partial [Lipomyces arxii]|uniref:guanine-1-methyltransferase-domain-containing protein n=1 Tax=Lipomyces arxii TaxID=56418 RepID=UPI0034CFE4C6
PAGMSRNAWKKEQKKVKWLENRDKLNKYKRDKKKEKKAEKRALKEQNADEKEVKKGRNDLGTRVPITILIDCGFDDMMTEKERQSLSLQLTRCYSENRRSDTPMNIRVCSFDKKLKERFDTTMKAQYKVWRGIEFSELPYAVPESDEERNKIVYLSSDSENTLTELEDNMTYIVGGIVDKGRYKNLCQNKATSQKIKTAKLPISEFLTISGRKVLTTNHVVEIMVKWVELRDWKRAFEEIIPPRKQEGFETNRQKRKRENRSKSVES